jgi:hypothetical protein
MRAAAAVRRVRWRRVAPLALLALLGAVGLREQALAGAAEAAAQASGGAAVAPPRPLPDAAAEAAAEADADPLAWPDMFTQRASPRTELAAAARRVHGAGAGVLVNLGLPRTGTSSLHELLRRSYNLTSAHFNCSPIMSSRFLPAATQAILEAFVTRFALQRVGGCGLHTCALRFNALQWHDAKRERERLREAPAAAQLAAHLALPAAALAPLAFAPGAEALTELNCFAMTVAFAPQITGLVRLLSAYAPGELVLVLTTRDDLAWAQSMRRFTGVGRWKTGMGRSLLQALRGRWFEDHFFPDVTETLALAGGEQTREGAAVLEAWLVALKRWHEQRVRALVAQSGHDFVELALGDSHDDGGGGGGLSRNLSRLATLLRIDPARVANYTRFNENLFDPS